jgi:SAM-dependent methyltransferase
VNGAERPSTAAEEGPAWSSTAELWDEHWARLADPAREVVLEQAAVGPGTRFLDMGCGTGELCVLAAARGATVSGIDAAEGMIEIARRRVPGADLRVGAMERLPWAGDSFDLVTAFNSFQFAAGFAAAVAEAARVARTGGHVAICNWGRKEEREVFVVLDRLHELEPPGPPSPPGPAIGEPGVLEDLMRAAGLAPVHADEVDVPYEVLDEATLERALRVDASEHVSDDAIRRVIAETAAPFRRPDGSYRFENRFRYVIARRR